MKSKGERIEMIEGPKRRSERQVGLSLLAQNVVGGTAIAAQGAT
jgi:hypothetical protein